MSSYMDYLARGVGYESYASYLRSDHWKLFSNAVRRKKCFCCGIAENLQVHHTTYERLGGEIPTDVVTVCDKCHKGIHRLVDNGVELEDAHYALTSNGSEKGHNKKGKPFGLTKKKWVHWKGLCNPAFRETPKDVLEFLIAKGYVREDNLRATKKAMSVRLFDARRRKWNKVRYLSLRRSERRQAKRTGDS